MSELTDPPGAHDVEHTECIFVSLEGPKMATKDYEIDKQAVLDDMAFVFNSLGEMHTDKHSICRGSWFS